jgi:2-methylcitrate dehydratase PrpD
VNLEDIVKVRVDTFHEAVRLGTRLPTTTEEAQFNMAWPVAAMMVDGEIGPAQTLEHRLDDPQIRSLAQKVEVVESPELNRLCDLFEEGEPRGHWASQVTLILKDGTQFQSALEDGGFRFPAPTWDESRMEDKFRWLVRDVLDEPLVDRLVDMVWQFDAVSDVGELTGMVTKP